eukprot:TRINITY_DN224_c0_g1_i5.p2 TRINITY_DN224_c0_g1~~TRINITY_DN224_c0_g1_i5.p2  ORF type:complete len:222 (+),score=55.81 TRINITY_DN224_c0_g1_i5:889-1554(+)
MTFCFSLVGVKWDQASVFFNGVRAAREVHKNRVPARKRKASETFEEPPAKKQAVEEITPSLDPVLEKATTEVEKPKEGSKEPKKMRVDVNKMKIFTDVDLEKIRDANTAKVVAMPKEKMDDQKSKLMSGLFTIGNKPPPRERISRPSNLTLTASIPAASPPKAELPSPVLPTIDSVQFSDDEAQTSDLPKAPTPKKRSKPPNLPRKKIRKKKKVPTAWPLV